MGDSFAIASVSGGRRLELSGGIPQGLTGYEGCSFTAALVGPDLAATVRVYDVNPQRWTGLFRSLAKDWRGWPDERAEESLEHHLRLECRSDRLGHVTIRVRLRNMELEDDWRVEANLQVEAGQLDRLAAEAADYFG